MAQLPTHYLSLLLGKNSESKEPLAPTEIRRAVIEELGEHYTWYDKSQKRLSAVWVIGTICIVLLGTVTTLAVALGWSQSDRGRIIVAVISAATTALSTLLATFATRDLWQLRENGRIAANDLIARACLIPDNDNQAALQEAVRLLNDAHKLEEAQAKGFFAFLPQKSDDAGKSR